MSSVANPATGNPQDIDIGTIRKLMKPLVERSGKSSSDLCNDYANLTTDLKNNADINESNLWSLLSDLSNKNPQINERYVKITKNDPELVHSVLFLQWLEKEYRKNPVPTEISEIPYYYIRTGQIEKYFEYLQKNKQNDWKIATLAGCLSQKDYKTWRISARNLANSKHISPDEAAIYSILSGDLYACMQYAKTYYDQLWAKIFCMLSDAEAKNPYDIKETIRQFPTPSNTQENLVFTVFRDGVDSLLKEQNLPLAFKIHTVSVFHSCPSDLIKQFIEPIVNNFALGIAFFYCSLAETDEAVKLISDILTGLPYPDEKALQITDYFKLPSTKIVDAAIDNIISSRVDDFDEDLTEEELIDRKIEALGWLEIARCEEVAEKKVRKLLGKLALEKQYKGCSKLLQTRGNLLTNQIERDSWNALVIAELKTTAQNLSEILLFKGGWMNRCDIEDEVARSILMLVSNQLIDTYIASGETERAMAVPAMICCPTKNMLRWLKPSDAKELLLKIKNVGIAQFKAANTE
ncbi:hypothetical protein TVAG_075540 [Trichomonas vaginalis G3]|uniref:Nuclear pore complex protein n=1 Tax=Trichomonas vaginalis (strain ATCC PRA-98 / G3) TaxID=412133 RepID=A2D9F1_TRIV3|nr:nuclear pore protein 84 / 107 family [Trichomonas vaginalis G3]EAY22807.1 hypothetical protein TVAG_075540 [Trichomonas vaginalis G3]KAI5526965.1 nuclear pore protein 84 / 107 family [Trichomonas vaginalis G3]|eukprot:XP_001583793.1 hypothetical protein [Trichomonas vaginalis G3]